MEFKSFRIVLVLCGFLVVTGVLFWPTLYRYERLTSRGTTNLIRIHRLTGQTEEYENGRWLSPKPERIEESVPGEELAKVTGRAGFIGSRNGAFSGDLYNGSSWVITSVTLRIVALGKSKQEIWARRFAHRTYILPLSTGSILIAVTDDEAVVGQEWSLEEARGYRPSLKPEAP
jgi:hypothetical protein